MGQRVVSLMYGISKDTPDLIVDEEYFWSFGEKSLKWNDERYPNAAYEGGVIGFPVASGPANDNDEGDLGETTPLSKIDLTHTKHLQSARKRWAAFAAWAEETHGKKLPDPELWITTDERA